MGGGQGRSTSQVSGARWAGSWASRSKRMVVPVRGWPQMTRGRRTSPPATSGWVARQSRIRSRLDRYAGELGLDDGHAQFVETGRAVQVVEHPVEALLPGGLAEVVEAGGVGRRGHQVVAGEGEGGHAAPPPRRRRPRFVTTGGSGWSSQRRVTKPRWRPPVSSQVSGRPVRTRRVAVTDDQSNLSVVPGRRGGVGRRAGPAAGIDALVPDVLDGHAPVAVARRGELDRERPRPRSRRKVPSM